MCAILRSELAELFADIDVTVLFFLLSLTFFCLRAFEITCTSKFFSLSAGRVQFGVIEKLTNKMKSVMKNEQ